MAQEEKKSIFGKKEESNTVNNVVSGSELSYFDKLASLEEEEQQSFSDFRSWVVSGSVQAIVKKGEEEDGSRNYQFRIPSKINGVADTKTVHLNTTDSEVTIMAMVGRKVTFSEITIITDRDIKPTADIDEKIVFLAKKVKDEGQADDGFDPKSLIPKNVFYRQSASVVGQIASITEIKASYGNTSGYAEIVIYYLDDDQVARPFHVLGDIGLVRQFRQMISDENEIVNAGEMIRLNGLRKQYEGGQVKWYAQELPTSK